MNRFSTIASVLFVCWTVTLPAHAQSSGPGHVDVIIQGGTVVDGTGGPERRADVAVSGDRIVFVGDAKAAGIHAMRTINARGLVVAPGFIDPHTHTLEDLSTPARRANVNYLMQGVTTVITNNDGGGTLDIRKTLNGWASTGIGTNAALYVGQGSVRRQAMGMSSAAPTPSQLDSMRAIVARGMSEGALGLSTGLYYAPGSYANTDEVIALATVAAGMGGIYDSHMRDESSYTIGLIGSVNETIRIGREAHIPVHISHIKALGADVWGQSDSVVALVNAARAAGLEVTADQYPYLASGSSVGASLLPRWAEAGGRDSLRARTEDPATRALLVGDMERNLTRRGGAASLLITAAHDRTLVSKTLADIAAVRHQTPIDAAIQIVLAGDADVASFNMKETDLETFMRQPWVMTGSDGSSGHPRKYGTFPRKLRNYVFTKHVLTLPQAIRASSGFTAEALRLHDRGVLAPGRYADLIVFDPRTIADRATYTDPALLAVGMRYVLVNGQVAVRDGKFTGVLAGRPLTRAQAAAGPAPAYAAQVEVRRTTHGVPHIAAQNLAAAAYALAYVQCEDYGPRVPHDLLRARGELGLWFGRDSIEHDFVARLAYRRAVETLAMLDQPTRDVYGGFAAGVNRYLELHPEEFPSGFAPRFTAYDVLANDVNITTAGQAAKFLARVDTLLPRDDARPAPPFEGVDFADEGSNAWAFASSRTTSGHAILLRNPHLRWNAGYYEAHLIVTGVLNFYGDFRIGGPFGVIGGFNRDLGWSTTNNDPLLGQIYALDVDSTRADHFQFDGTSVPLTRELVTAEFRNGTGLARESREVLRTPLGPVLYRANGKIYVLRAAADGDFRAGEQFLRMMRAHSLAEWKDAMRMRARVNSSFTYADRAGNIFYIWNAAIPALPQASGGDTAAVPARRTDDTWTRYVSFDSLPQVLNPAGGYVHNENDAPYYTNMRQPLDPAWYPPYFPAPRLGLRSQLAIELIDTKQKLSLADVVTLKHSYRMLLADRVRDDLVQAVRTISLGADIAQAIDVIARWDGTVGPASRGGVLFETWWRRYIGSAQADTMFAQPWSPAAPTTTPRGIRFPAIAVEAFAWAVPETVRHYGRADVAWGDVHRVRIGDVDAPVGGCSGDIGCFRVLAYREQPDGKRAAVGGDGWILAVEFGDQPRAYSVLAYGESTRPESPYHSDQAAMFARGELKPVAWTTRDIEAQTVRRYRPGAQR